MYFEEIKLGQRFEVGPVAIQMDDITAFAQKYDPLPLHLDEQFAQTTRYKTRIAPGVMSFMAVWAEFARMNIWGRHLIAGRDTYIKWFAPVFAGDELCGTVTITNLKRSKPEHGSVEQTVDIVNQHGKLVIRNVTWSAVRARPETFEGSAHAEV